MNLVSNLRDYANRVFDVNKDGVVNIKDFFRLFPSQAVAIAVIFIDVVILASEYRVWDVGYKMTGDVFKAIGFVLVSAVPFLLGQIFWLNPFANFVQKRIGELFVVSSLYIGWVFGTADLSQSINMDVVVSTVVNATVGYIVLSLVYVLVDERIKAWRLQQQIKAHAKQEEILLGMTRKSLEDLKKTQTLQKEIEAEFGDSELVQEQLDRLRGRKSSPKN